MTDYMGFRRGDFVAWEHREVFGGTSVYSGRIQCFAEFRGAVCARVKGSEGGKKWVVINLLSHVTKGPSTGRKP